MDADAKDIDADAKDQLDDHCKAWRLMLAANCKIKHAR